MDKKDLIELLKKESSDSTDTQASENINVNRNKTKSNFNAKSSKSSKAPYVLLIITLIAVIIFLVSKSPNNLLLDLTKNTNNPTFSDLPSETKNLYILKTDLNKSLDEQKNNFTTEIKKLEDEITILNEKFELANIEKNEIKVDAEKNRSNTYDATGCYEEQGGGYALYSSCESRLGKFLIKNKKANSFQIIPIMDLKDRNYINNIVKKFNSNEIDKAALKQYLREGIARKRVLEAAKFVKSKLGKNVIITYVNYIADTGDKKGFSIRAYK